MFAEHVWPALEHLASVMNIALETELVNDTILSDSRENTIFNTTFMIGPIPANLSLEGTPHAGAQIGLFVGVGFDVGIAAVKAGIEGSVSLGEIYLPAYAGVGIGLGTQVEGDDERPLPAYLDGLATKWEIIPRKKISPHLVYTYGADMKLYNILQGRIGVKVKLKFLFFSKSWRKTIVQIAGLCPESGSRPDWCDINLFGGEGSVEIAKGSTAWGDVQMPMPFMALGKIRAAQFHGDEVTHDFDYKTDVEAFFYDDLCVQIIE